MKASLQLITVPVYVVRMHEDDHGDPLFLDDYVGLSVVVPRDDLGVVQGLCVPSGYDRAARAAILAALKDVGIKRVRAARVREGTTEKESK